MSAFTKGPWRLSKTQNGFELCVDGVSGEGRGGWFVELHMDSSTPEIAAEDEANAHLIAAAPDLYEALQIACDLLDECEKAFEEEFGNINPWRELRRGEKIMGVIKKAEGKP